MQRLAHVLKNYYSKSGLLLRNMSNKVFVADKNAITGKMEWVVKEDNYDYVQEIARSAYADMLHDTERNKMYEAALQKAIYSMHKAGKKAHVLDIGAGSGLLSMMAARAGADSVYACEVFEPMALCCEKILRKNGFADKVKLIKKRSTEVEIGPDKDMPDRANVLVAEVFDTELIGEGAISTFNHAHKYLLEEDCIVVPAAANMYVQVVESNILVKRNTLCPTFPGLSQTVVIPSNIRRYDNGLAAPFFDLQLSQLKESHFTKLTDPVKVFGFNFSKGETDKSYQKTVSTVAGVSGVCHAVLMWWDLEMDGRGSVLTCAPRWAHPTPKSMQWRDHWMQAVLYPSSSVQVSQGSRLFIRGQHDEYSLSFDLSTSESFTPLISDLNERHTLHTAFPRTHLGAINDSTRNEKYVSALRALITPDSVCLSISDGSFMPFVCARLGAKKVYSVESLSHTSRALQSLVSHNELDNQVTVVSRASDIPPEDMDKVTLFISEPHFHESYLPWHNLRFWYDLTSLNLHQKKVHILPGKAVLKAVPMQFSDLHKIKTPIGVCEGFHLDFMDDIIDSAMNRADDLVESQPLWEYPGTALSKPITLLKFDFSKSVHELTKSETEMDEAVPFEWTGQCTGVALWMEYHLNDSTVLSHGPTQEVLPGQLVNWDMNSQQGVRLFTRPYDVKKDVTYLQCTLKFSSIEGELSCNFQATNNPVL